jgi:hypothetical protein
VAAGSRGSSSSGGGGGGGSSILLVGWHVRQILEQQWQLHQPTALPTAYAD